MIFLFPRWDMLVPWRVYNVANLNSSRHGLPSTFTNGFTNFWWIFLRSPKPKLHSGWRFRHSCPIHSEDLLTCKIIRDTTAHQAIVAYLGEMSGLRMSWNGRVSFVPKTTFRFLLVKKLKLSEEHSRQFFLNDGVVSYSPAYLPF